MKTALITGGSGFLGINLCRYLHERGYKIHVLDIADFDYEDMKPYVKFFKGDIRNITAVSNATEGVDFVIHTAAALPLYKPRDIFTTDVNGTRNVLEAAKLHGVKRVVHISSTAVYGIPDHHPLKEDDKLIGVGPYGRAKIAAEEVCEEYRKKGLIVPVLRPKSFIGPERLGVFAIYYDWISRNKNVPIVGRGNNRYQLLDVEDLCEASYLCLEKSEKIVNDTFNIGAKEFTTMKQDFGSVLKYHGAGKKIIGVPATPLILLLRFLEKLKLSPLYKWVYETAPHDSFVSIEKAEKILGFTPKYSNKDTLIRNYQWYINHKKEFENLSGESHRVPWKQGILRMVSWFF